jgi:serine/threonine protein phosphatase PrpC
MYDAVDFTSSGGHPVNEDSIKLIRENDRLIAIVADGLGSHGGGDVASAAAVAALQNALPERGVRTEAAFSECLEEANRAVLSRQKPGLEMKSTVVMLAAEKGWAIFAHVGDSRGYFFRGGRVYSQTMDHSVSQMAVLRGDITPEQIRFHESRSKLLRALGADEKAHGEITPLDAPREGDAFLLCSDGFWEYITEAEMEIDLSKSIRASDWMSLMFTRIGSRVPADHDNLSAICVICK